MLSREANGAQPIRDLMPVLDVVSGTALVAVGVMLLYLSWQRRRQSKAHLQWGGWLLIAAGFSVFCLEREIELGVTYGALALAFVAYAIIVWGIELRQSSARAPREPALEPEDRPTNWPRGIAKSLLAIVLAGIASIGVGVAIAVAMPLAAYDRIMLGGILVPLLWGGGMAWTLSDAKLLRATIVLIVVSAVSYAIAFLPKVLT